MSTDLSVKLVDLTTAAVCGIAALDHQSAGFIVLEATHRVREIGGGLVDAESVMLDASGSVQLSGKIQRADEARSTRALRALLDGLLQVTPDSTAKLRLCACRPESTDLALLARELEGALAPFDRAAGKKAVASLAKATREGAMHGDFVAPSREVEPTPPPPKSTTRVESKQADPVVPAQDLERERARVRELEAKFEALRVDTAKQIAEARDESIAAIAEAEQGADRRVAEAIRVRDNAIGTAERAADAMVARAVRERDAAVAAARTATSSDLSAQLEAQQAQARAEKIAAIAAAELSADRRVAEATRERDESIAAAREATERRVAEILRGRDLAVSAARQEADRRVAEAERLREEATAAADARIEELRREHEAALESLREDRDSSLAAARSERDALLAAARTERDRAIEEVRRERDRRIAEHEARLREMESDHQAAMAETAREHSIALADAETRRTKQLEEATARLRKVMLAEREAALVDLRHGHEVTLSSLRAEHEGERSALRAKVYDLEHELARACADRDAERTLRVDAEASAAKRVRELRRSLARSAPEEKVEVAPAPVAQYWPMEPPKPKPSVQEEPAKENAERYRGARSNADSPPPPSPTGRRMRSPISISLAERTRDSDPAQPMLRPAAPTPVDESRPRKRSTASLVTTFAVVGSLLVTVVMTCRGSGAIAALFAPPPPDMGSAPVAAKPAPSLFGGAPKVCEATLTLEAMRADTEVLRKLGKAPFAVTLPMHVPLELVATLESGAARRLRVDASAPWRTDTVVPQLPLAITLEPLGDRHWPARTSSSPLRMVTEPSRGLVDITSSPAGATVWLAVDPAGIAVPCGIAVDLMLVPQAGVPKPIRIDWSTFRGSPARASVKL